MTGPTATPPGWTGAQRTGAVRIGAAVVSGVVALVVVLGAVFTVWLSGQSFGGPDRRPHSAMVLPAAVAVGAALGYALVLHLLVRTRRRWAAVIVAGVALLTVLAVVSAW